MGRSLGVEKSGPFVLTDVEDEWPSYQRPQTTGDMAEGQDQIVLNLQTTPPLKLLVRF